MVEYYFDMETTGRNLETDEIITIQWQKLDRFTGKPIGELNILKRWEFREKEDSEKEMLKTFLPNLKCKPFDFVFVGNNLLFDFCFLSQRIKEQIYASCHFLSISSIAATVHPAAFSVT